VRTGADSRATLLLSDRSVIRLNQSAVVEIKAPSRPESGRRFRLRAGKLFFFNRERPMDVEFETPVATGAIRGTEFLLEVDPADGTTRLAILDGEVELTAGDSKARVKGGEEAVVRPGAVPERRPLVEVASRVQWVLYYPGVLHVPDLALTAAEKSAWRNSLAAYSSGDLAGALAALPTGAAGDSDGARAYVAALRLGAGEVEEAERLLSQLPQHHPAVAALGELMATVRSQPWTPSEAPASASEWLAHSYRLQSEARLDEALSAARRSVTMSPEFGFGWVRVAELEFGFEHVSAMRAALEAARRWSPGNPRGATIEGYALLARGAPGAALVRFDDARRLDGSFAEAWVGRALCLARLGRFGEARQDLQVAAALEPRRGIVRSYLGKAWGASGEDALAEKEFRLARELDPADPTAWLYSALQRYQTHRLNEAVRDLERSVELNDNRSLFRSRYLLDRDRATRSADLSAIYDSVGLGDVGERAAARAVQDDYSNFSGHLFLSRSLQSGQVPSPFDLRMETPRQSELLLANLLAPAGGGNLSLLLSQQDRLQSFDPRPVGGSSFTEYRSTGDFDQALTLFGQVGGLSYAVDGEYSLWNDRRVNNDRKSTYVSTQLKQQIGESDSLYLQVSDGRGIGGDLARYYDPGSANALLRYKEAQEPGVFLGWHHEWTPGSHTLLFASRLQDRLVLQGPTPNVLKAHLTGGVIDQVLADPFFSENLHSEYTLHSVELQQIWENEHHTLVAGGRYQQAAAETEVEMSRGLGTLVTPVGAPESVSPGMERINGYALYTWHPIPALHLTAGLSYDHLSYPQNVDLPPVSGAERSASRVSPKVGLTLRPWKDGYLRAAYTRSLGGLYFDDSVRLEPTQLAGFVTSYRSLIPESASGLLAGADFETWGAGFDQRFAGGTYVGVSGEILKSDGDRGIGIYTSTLPLALLQLSPAQTVENLDFEERSLTLYVSQLLGEEWAAGVRYRLSQAELSSNFPLIPTGATGAGNLSTDQTSVLGQLKLFVVWNHPSGFFAGWDSDAYHQSNRGYSPDRPGDSFWQHNVHAGYRFPRRRAEIRVGVLNLNDQDYRVNPLNYVSTDIPRRRTFYTSLRINF
jgi:tetratricopeptide (TPR) repeat protein